MFDFNSIPTNTPYFKIYEIHGEHHLAIIRRLEVDWIEIRMKLLISIERPEEQKTPAQEA